MNSIIQLSSTLPTMNLFSKRVLLRADLNVPFRGTVIADDYRLKALLPTIDLILERGGKIILATHIGRPVSFDANLSTSLLVPWFEQRGYAITYVANLHDAYQKSLEENKTIMLLENMRFFPGEKHPDPQFTMALASLADVYVNDAFALLHRNDSSITQLPMAFAPDKRTIGLLVEKELTMLNTLLRKPQKPFVLAIGGGKIADKLPLLNSLLPLVDEILLCPAIVFTFLAALGKPVGKSLVDASHLETCKELLDAAHNKGVKIHFPIDYQNAINTFNGPLSYVDAEQFPENAVGISIGPKTIKIYSEILENASTSFYNGLMGSMHNIETVQGTGALLKAMGNSRGFSIVGGGDAVAAAVHVGADSTISYLSTGGGATLAYLAGSRLPGLEAFI